MISPKQYIISIEGNIGSGKTRLFSALQSRVTTSDVCFLPEPLDVWARIHDQHGISILEAFYKDKHKYSLPMQLTALISRYEGLARAKQGGASLIITERCLGTDAEVFAPALYRDGYLNDIEMGVYRWWHGIFQTDHRPDGMVFVEATPALCMQRICERDRAGENLIPIELLETYDEFHVKFEAAATCPVVSLCGDDLQLACEQVRDLVARLTDNEIVLF
jgi:deoxyadenosine/deoxycytidine kinase